MDGGRLGGLAAQRRPDRCRAGGPAAGGRAGRLPGARRRITPAAASGLCLLQSGYAGARLRRTSARGKLATQGRRRGQHVPAHHPRRVDRSARTRLVRGPL
jgi:hypothetical protein